MSTTTMEPNPPLSTTALGALVVAGVTGLVTVFGFMARWIFGTAIIARLDKMEKEHNRKSDQILKEVSVLVSKQGDSDRVMAVMQAEFTHLRGEIREQAKEIQALRDRYHRLTNIIQVRQGEE